MRPFLSFPYPEMTQKWYISPTLVRHHRWVNGSGEPMREEQLVAVRECLNRQRPFGKTDSKRRWHRSLDSEVPYVRVAGRGAKRKVACPSLYPLLMPGKFSRARRSGPVLYGQSESPVATITDLRKMSTKKKQSELLKKLMQVLEL
jgi:hypothetical protein